jgi:hypothetical protein
MAHAEVAADAILSACPLSFHPHHFTKDGTGDMARKTVSIKAKRAEVEAAEAREAGSKKTTKKSAADKPAKVKKEKAVKDPKKPAAKKTTRRKVAKVSRMKAYWGVFTQGWKRVAMFEYADKKAADKKAAELVASSRANHIVQLVKEPITE